MNHRCDNCNQVWDYEELDGIKDLEQRVDVGGVVPSGECPDCGALCYVDEFNRIADQYLTKKRKIEKELGIDLEVKTR